MLSSRYLHLHEALGLGPMWLNQGAKILPSAAAATSEPAETSYAPPARAAEPQPASVSVSHARLDAIAAVGKGRQVSDGTSAPSHRPSEKTQPDVPVPSAAEQTLSAAIPNPSPVITAEIRPVRVMVVSICPALEDSAAGQLFSGDAGILLDNMLAAAGLKPADAHKTVWVKTAAVFTPEPSPEQIAGGLPQLQAELAVSQARAVLFLGQIFAQPHHAESIRRLCADTPYFIIPHPARLLRQPHLKRQAWEELKKLRLAVSA